jgi:hypothetical protein
MKRAWIIYLTNSAEWAANPAPKAVSHLLSTSGNPANELSNAARTLGLLMLP